MFSWHAIPFARLLLPFAAGILLQNALHVPVECIATGFIASAAILPVYLRCFSTRQQLQYNTIPGIALTLLYMLAAMFTTEQLKPEHAAFNKITLQNADAYKVRIVGNPEFKNAYYTSEAEIESLFNNNGEECHTDGKVLLRLHQKACSIPPETGHLLMVTGSIRKPDGPIFPGSFDYSSYLRHQKILYILESGKHQTVYITGSEQNVFSMAAFARDKGLEWLRAYIPSKSNSGIAEALLLGYRSHIDKLTNNAFRDTGTLHILSVSGLHVGLIFMLLGMVSGFLEKHRAGKFARLIFMLAGLWIYAFLTGLSPSVVRASIMLSLVGTGKLFRGPIYIFNIVYASAFLMLVSDTALLFNPGFQLSYAAVLGILFLYPKLNSRFRPGNKAGAYVFDLAAVSLSARQIFTFPLSLFYFNQFPVFFLIYNMVLIPIFTLALFMALAIVVLSWIPAVAASIGYLLNMLLNICKDLLLSNTLLPHAVVDHLYTDLFQMILLYLMVLTAIAYALYASKRMLLYLLLVWLCFETYGSYRQIKQKNNINLAVLQLNLHPIYICSDSDSIRIIIDGKKPLHTNTLNGIRNYIARIGFRPIKVLYYDKSIVGTNFRLIPEIGFQFFDKIVTMRKYVDINGQLVLNNNQMHLNKRGEFLKNTSSKPLHFSILERKNNTNITLYKNNRFACNKVCRSRQFIEFKIDKL